MDTKYVIVEDDQPWNFCILEVANTVAEAKELESKLLKTRWEKEDISIKKVDVVTIKTEYDDSDDLEHSSIEVDALIDGEAVNVNFVVQLTNGFYEPQNHCLISNSNGDDDFTANEKIIFSSIDVAALAEQAAAKSLNNKYELIDAGFGELRNNCELKIRLNKITDSAELLMVDTSHNPATDYGRSVEEIDSFSSLEAAKQYLAQFVTIQEFLDSQKPPRNDDDDLSI